VILLQGFFLAFLGFLFTFFFRIPELSDAIVTGDIDKYLCRPMNPLVVYVFEYIDPIGANMFVRAAVYFAI
jgi:ABC-type uncharacterized transport system permease subunit